MGVLTVDSLLASYIANVVRDHYSSFYNSYLHMAAVAVIMVYDYISVYSDLRKVWIVGTGWTYAQSISDILCQSLSPHKNIFCDQRTDRMINILLKHII